MPRDRSPRPPRSVPYRSGFTGSSSHQHRPRNYNTGRPHRLIAESILISPADHAVPQPSAITNVGTSTAGHGHSITSPQVSLLAGLSHDTSVTNDVPPDLHLSQLPSSVPRQKPQFHLTPEYHDDRYPAYQPQHEPNNLALLCATPPFISASNSDLCTQPYPTPPVDQNHSIGTQYHTLYRPPVRYPQVRTASHLTALLEQQGSTSLVPNHRSTDMFYQAHDFVINNPIFINNSSDNFMPSFLKETILGAEFDSSDRNMPLRCHPGTRLKTIKRCQDFILNRNGRTKIRWVVGAAGVGKSAVMQSIAHDESHVLANIIIGATIFFSVNGREDGTKAITTIAYQLAVKLNPYRSFAQREIERDPSLLRKSLSRQFNTFIVEPFIHQRILDFSSRVLIIIDGLDECDDPSVQRELLGLISDFCITYPHSPIVWMIASRPEPHITSFFSQPKVALSFEKEEILVDSDEAYDDIKRYLRDKFREIQMASIPLQELSQWPPERDLFKIANASGGLFAYASTVVRYIGDPNYGDPVSLLDDVLEIIKTGTKKNIWGRNHPMAQLDALYSHIMSKIPANVMANTRKLLLCLIGWKFIPFQLQCNMLGMTQNAAYGATHHIRSIAFVPGPTEAGCGFLEFFHKSFPDYLQDFERSGFSPDIRSEAEQLGYHCALRILKEAPDNIAVHGALAEDDENPDFESISFKNCSRTSKSISVSWPAVDSDIQLDMFGEAILYAMRGFKKGEEAFQSLFCIRALTTCFTQLPKSFPFGSVRDSVFVESRRREFLEHGILKEVGLETLDYDAIMKVHQYIQLRFRGPIVEHSNPWNISCKHEREGSWEGHSQDWSTSFQHAESYSPGCRCHYCFERFTRHFKTRSPGQLVTVLDLTPTLRWVELRFVDPDDGVSDWVYHFFVGEEEQGCYDDDEDDIYDCYEDDEDVDFSFVSWQDDEEFDFSFTSWQNDEGESFFFDDEDVKDRRWH